MTHRRALRLAFTTVVAAGALAFPGAAAAVTPAQAAGLLGQQRRANGLPPLRKSAALDDGCAKHNRYIRLNGGALTHVEDPSRPGYTSEGARKGANSAGEVLATREGSWDGAWKTPWNGAPIHELIMFSPRSKTTGYAENDGVRCMRFQQSGRTPADTFSHPGDGATGVPTEIEQREFPYTPAEALGLPARTGQSIHVWRGDKAALIASATLTGTGGAADIRWLDARSPTPDGSRYSWDGVATFVPVGALRAFARYALRVTFTDGLTYRTSFTTGAAPPPPSATSFPPALAPPAPGGGATGAGGRGRTTGTRPVRRRAQKVRLSLRGRALKVISGPAYGAPRYAQVRFKNARGRTIVVRRVRLSGTRRLRAPRGTRRIELRAAQTGSRRPVVLLLRVRR